MIRDFAGSIGERAGPGESDVATLELAVDEACANVIEHAYGSDSTRARPKERSARMVKRPKKKGRQTPSIP